MVEGKKRKKLKKLVKTEPKISQKSSQRATQITKVNIKIGDDKKKAKRKRKKKAGGASGAGGGGPQRLRRRPHLPSNSMIGAINYTPPPGYLTPNDIRLLYAQPPPPLPPAVLPQAPLVPGQLVAGQVVEGQPVAVAARPGVVQPQGRPRVALVNRIQGFGNSPRSARQSSFPRPQNTSAIYGPRSADAWGGGEQDGVGQAMSGINTGATAFIGGRPLPQGSSVMGNGGSHRAEVAHLHLDAAGSPGGAARLYAPAAMSTRNLRNRAIVVPSGGRRGGSGGASASGGAIPVVRQRRGASFAARVDSFLGGPARREKKAARRRAADDDDY